MSRIHPHPSSGETNDIARLRRDVSLSSTVTQYGYKLSRNGRELETCCPFHAEDTPSFKIFIAHDGVERFHCFGCGKQGDVLDFVREVKGVDLPEAIRILGGIGSRPNARPEPVKAPDVYEGITALPQPADLLQAGRPVRLYNPKRRGGRSEWGSFAPSMVFPYRNADGSLFGYVLRHDLADGAKETPMVMYVRLADGTQTWCRLPFPKPRPLYGLQDIGEEKVIVVEGEKCRDRLSMASGRAVVSWPGGTQGVKHTDWSPLSGRDVLIWPDFDPPGMAAANEIARQLTSLGARIRLAGFADPDAASAPECYRFDDWRAGLFPSRGWDCADALDDGWTQAEIDAFMQETARPFALPGAEDEKPVTAQRAGRASRRKAVVGEMPSQTREGDGRPRLIFHEADLSEVVTSACRLVVDAGARLYARDTALFRAVRVAGKEKTVLVPADEAALIDILSKHVLWLKPDERKKLGYRDISCPALVARSIIARHGDWPFPQIRAIVSLPMMRSDGTIINAQGFDRQSGILFESDKTWPEIPECPDRASAVTALESIRKLVASFPFVSGVDESAALAMILTAIVRPSLKTAPLFGVNATAPGTGKSKLVDVAAILATGRLAAVSSHAGDDSELRKVLESRLLHGDSFITLDNLSVPLRSDHLCQVLSQEEVSIRPLGHTLSLDSATAAMFCATGNGLRFAGDLTRRVVLINLDAGVERPEERVFESDVIEDTRRQRVEIVTSALTLLRAFVANEADKVSPALGSFEQWSNLVRSALVWLGLPDPLGNAAKIRDNDPEKERTSAIIAALPAGKPWAAADIARMVDEGAFDPVGNRRHEGLVEALGEFIEYGKLNTTRFSGFLRKHVGRIVNGQMIEQAGKNRVNAMLWKIQNIAEPGDVEGKGAG